MTAAEITPHGLTEGESARCLGRGGACVAALEPLLREHCRGNTVRIPNGILLLFGMPTIVFGR